MRELVTALRHAVERMLPWYDPEREALRDRRAKLLVRQATRLENKVGAYDRIGRL